MICPLRVTDLLLTETLRTLEAVDFLTVSFPNLATCLFDKTRYVTRLPFRIRTPILPPGEPILERLDPSTLRPRLRSANATVVGVVTEEPSVYAVSTVTPHGVLMAPLIKIIEDE